MRICFLKWNLIFLSQRVVSESRCTQYSDLLLLFVQDMKTHTQEIPPGQICVRVWGGKSSLGFHASNTMHQINSYLMKFWTLKYLVMIDWAAKKVFFYSDSMFTYEVWHSCKTHWLTKYTNGAKLFYLYEEWRWSMTG